MAHTVTKDGVTYTVGQVLHLKEVVWMGVPEGYQIVVAELRDPRGGRDFIGADLEGIEDRCFFETSDLLEGAVK